MVIFNSKKQPKSAVSYIVFLSILFLSFLTIEGRVSPVLAIDLDTIIVGSDYKFVSLPRGAKPNMCQKACDSDGRCKVWTFIKQRVKIAGGSKIDMSPKERFDDRGRRKKIIKAQCRLKYATGHKVYNECCTSGKKKKVNRGAKSIKCTDYASLSILNFDKNLQDDCRLRGSLWNDDFGFHYDRCMKKPRRWRQRNLGLQKDGLKACLRNDRENGKDCENYAEIALQIVDQGNKNNCSRMDLVWPKRYSRILSWCERKDERRRRRVMNKAQNQLSRCLKAIEMRDEDGDDYADGGSDDRGDTSREDWAELGCKTLSNRMQRYTIEVGGRASGKFKAVRVKVKRKSAKFRELQVTFGNGSQNDYDISRKINSSDYSKAFRFKKFKGKRFIRRINVKARSIGSFLFRRSQICLEGLKLKPKADDYADNNPDPNDGGYDDGNMGGSNRALGVPTEWIKGFAKKKGMWNKSHHIRMMADVNGDKKDDVVGFGDDGVYVALARNGRFAKASKWVKSFGRKAGSWDKKKHPRFMADVNGDGKADIVGFGNYGVYVSLARRGRFSEPEKWVGGFGNKSGGWNMRDHIRMLADVNGDGKADLVGFADKGVYVSLARRGRFSEPERWVDAFGRKAGGWSVRDNIRTMADVNGDGKADIVGFGNSGVFVSLARNGRFTRPEKWVRAFGRRAGDWNKRDNIRTLADVNGDGKADIIGFGSGGVYVSLARRGRFSKPEKWVKAFGRRAGGWQMNEHPRMVRDVDGDGKADILGIRDDGVYVSYARRNKFTKPEKMIGGFGQDDGGWSRQHPRMLADVNGDGKADIVGFGNYGVYVSESGRGGRRRDSYSGGGRRDRYDDGADRRNDRDRYDDRDRGGRDRGNRHDRNDGYRDSSRDINDKFDSNRGVAGKLRRR